METEKIGRIFCIALVIATLLALILIVSGAGCGETSAENDAKALDSEFGNIEETSNEIKNMNLDELSETDLEELESLL